MARETLAAAGLDSNIVCYMLDSAFPEHKAASGLVRALSPTFTLAINPTALHESYHTLVYDQKWVRREARARLLLFMRHPHIKYYNQTKTISRLAFSLAERYDLGGRDSLILANFLENRVPEVFTHDHELSRIGEVSWKGIKMRISDPIQPQKRKT